MCSKTKKFRSPLPVQKALGIFLLAGMSLFFISALIDSAVLLDKFFHLNSPTLPLVMPAWIDFGLCLNIIFVFTVFLGLVWIYTSVENNWVLDEYGRRISPDLAAAGFIIPLLNLWIPFLVFRDLCRGVEKNRSNLKQQESYPQWILLWLSCLVLSLIFLGISYAQKQPIDGLEIGFVALLSVCAKLFYGVISYLILVQTREMSLQQCWAVKQRGGDLCTSSPEHSFSWNPSPKTSDKGVSL